MFTVILSSDSAKFTTPWNCWEEMDDVINTITYSSDAQYTTYNIHASTHTQTQECTNAHTHTHTCNLSICTATSPTEILTSACGMLGSFPGLVVKVALASADSGLRTTNMKRKYQVSQN